MLLSINNTMMNIALLQVFYEYEKNIHGEKITITSIETTF